LNLNQNTPQQKAYSTLSITLLAISANAAAH